MARTRPGDATPFIAVGVIAVSFFLYAWSAIVVPGVVTRVLLPLLWVVMVVLTVRWSSARPRLSLAPAALTLVAWFVVLYGGLA